MTSERAKPTAMPGWVKLTIGLGLLILVAIAVLAADGHGPSQHGTMSGMHG
jgi:hypothetical protein